MNYKTTFKYKLKQAFLKNYTGYLFIMPVILGILIFTLTPMGLSMYYSFAEGFNGFTAPKSFGLENYIKIFTKMNEFWTSVRVTLVFTVISVPFGMITSFALAMLLNNNIKGMKVYRLLFYLPVIIPITINGLLWRDILNPTYGIANAVFRTFGIPESRFLESAASCLPTIIISGFWGIGGGMVLWLSALRNVPPTLVEAAKIDGANPFVRFFKIVIPMCTPIIFYVLITSLIGSLQTFAGIMALTGGRAGPGSSNALLFYVMLVYFNAFDQNMGMACALSWLLFGVIALLTLVIFKSSKWVFYGEDA